MIAARAGAAWAVFTACAGCDGGPLRERARVDSPRVLAVIAEPPEAHPGESIALRPILGGVRGAPALRWSVCATPEATTTFTAQSTFGQAEPDTGCFGDAGTPALPLGTGPSITLAVPADLLARVEALRAVYGANISAANLLRIAETAGLPVTVALELSADGATVRAIKRVLVSTHDARNHNPPPPSFRFGVSDGGTGGMHVTAAPDSPDACAAGAGATLEVAHGARVELAPDATEDAWLESYDALDSSGGVTHLRETAFYAWFATAGTFSSDRTRIPTRDTVWTAPEVTGEVSHWLVVRDGRGGTSACQYRVRVR